MIPIRLEFEAFGPFPKKQIIDFTKLENDRLFLISGQTGSGKTTIFDAITFALFGQASGSTRQSDSFKSDFADISTICYVEYEFIIKGHRYIVKREPIQIRLKRNNNLVKENSTATLTFDNGEIITGPVMVDKHIEQLLGINADQFKKIVMLPQGEFRKFLSDDSSEKQKILRKIFSTKIFDDFTEQLRINTSKVKSNLDVLLTQNETLIDSISWISDFDYSEIKGKIYESKNDIDFVIDNLSKFNKQIKDNLEKEKIDLDKLNKEKQDINLPFYEQINKKFDDLDKTQNEYNLLKTKKDEILNLQNKLLKVKWAKDIYPTYTFIENTKRHINVINDKLKDYKIKIKENTEAIKEKENEYKQIKELKNNIPLYIKRVEEIKYIQGILKEIDLINNEIKNLNKNYANKINNLKSVEYYYKYSLLNQECEEYKNKNIQFKELETNILNYQGLTKEYLKIKNYYKEIFNSFINGQASMLANGLKDDSPCPVCGSLVHPNKAVSNGENVSQENLDKAKNDYEKITRLLESSLATCKQLISSLELEERKDNIIDYLPIVIKKLSLNDKKINEILNQIDLINLRQDLANIKPIPKPESIQKKVNEIEKTILIITQNKENKSLQLETLQNKTQTNVSIVELQKEKIKIENDIQLINDKSQTLENILKSLSSANERALEAEQQMNNQIKDLQTDLNLKKEEFDNLLIKENMKLDKFMLLIQSINQIDEMQIFITNYNNDISIKKALIESLENELKQQTKVDLSNLQEKVLNLDEEIKSKNEKYISYFSAFNKNKEIILKLKSAQKKYQELSLQYASINKLFEVANGKYSDRVNFERYVLASYFNDVIINANIRLEQMTSSRYSLMRRIEKEKGNKSSGLALDVFDTYTGKARHVNTLSGGESFKIALALALGLADIISQNSGGIELNTMFIDEGFGSLDSNSLDSAVEALNELRTTGRYIGIISHVSELKEKIPSKIIVMQQPTGSYIQM